MAIRTSPSTTAFVLRLLRGAVLRYRSRTALALALIVLAKLATVGVPLALKAIVDAFSGASPIVVLPVFLLLGYAILRFLGTLFGEIRDLVFSRVSQSTVSGFMLQAFDHLHRLSVRFHAARHTGGVARDVERGTTGIGFLLGVARDVERGTTGIGFLLGVALFTILPTLVGIGAVITVVISLNYSGWFTLIILVTFALYGAFTLTYTERRTIHQRQLNRPDSTANSRDARGVAFDSSVTVGTAPILGNPASLKQILWRLGKSAVAATPPGGRIEARIERAESRVQLILAHNDAASEPALGDFRALLAQQGGRIEPCQRPNGMRGIVIDFPLRDAA